MAQWTPVESFDIDDGSLDGLSDKQCFVLGSEWKEFYSNLLRGKRFSMIVHNSNVARLHLLAERRSRFVESREALGTNHVEIFVGDSRDLPPCD